MQINCKLCPKKCNSIRTADSNIGGFCNMPLEPVIARAALHFGEEPFISGKNGSGTVFFSGCNLRCVYCQNLDISHNNRGEIISFKRLAEIFYELEQSGANNINLVNPSHQIFAIKEALKIYKPKIPLVYNSSGYDNAENITDLFDIYLMDFKYINGEKSLRYSNVADYPNVAVKAIKKAYGIHPQAVFDNNGIMQKGLIIRHLVLPMATNQTIKILDWVKDNAPNAYLSLMSQYTPMGDLSGTQEINRKITRREYEKVLNYCCNINLNNVFIQELNSTGNEFIPNFDGTGV